jgi:diaminohydroxyphosphoribosylaminopyrimidine deaminase/5-amino-6-(5-phosphoribosylamino)uracil reductase
VNDEYYMNIALKLASKGRGHVSPNPMVGAVIVKKEKIIGRGYHQCHGESHAEVNAIKNAAEDISGATLYVTLEPCCHEGKTPPCVEIIAQKKIARVVIGAIDSNPLVCRQGINYLQSRGIEVKTGVLENECRNLNEVFFHFMETGLPFVTIKYAQTLDGRIATTKGQSQWISSEASLKYVHKLRAEHDAVLVGIGTIKKDDPELTVRLIRGRNPLRIVIDSKLQINNRAKVLKKIFKAKTIIVTVNTSSDHKHKYIAATGAQIITVDDDKEGKVDLKKLLKELAARGITSVLIEGGAKIITSILKDNLADRLVTVIAPKILGKGIEAVGDLNIKELNSAKFLSIRKIRRCGEDIIIDSRFL